MKGTPDRTFGDIAPHERAVPVRPEHPIPQIPLPAIAGVLVPVPSFKCVANDGVFRVGGWSVKLHRDSPFVENI